MGAIAIRIDRKTALLGRFRAYRLGHPNGYTGSSSSEDIPLTQLPSPLQGGEGSFVVRVEIEGRPLPAGLPDQRVGLAACGEPITVMITPLNSAMAAMMRYRIVCLLTSPTNGSPS